MIGGIFHYPSISAANGFLKRAEGGGLGRKTDGK